MRSGHGGRIVRGLGGLPEHGVRSVSLKSLIRGMTLVWMVRLAENTYDCLLLLFELKMELGRGHRPSVPHRHAGELLALMHRWWRRHVGGSSARARVDGGRVRRGGAVHGGAWRG